MDPNTIILLIVVFVGIFIYVGGKAIVKMTIKYKTETQLIDILQEFIHTPAESAIPSVDEMFESLSVRQLPCLLVVDYQLGTPEQQDISIYDLSQYDKRKIIGLTLYYTENDEEYEIYKDNELPQMILKNQIVHELRGGGYQWDFRKVDLERDLLQ